MTNLNILLRFLLLVVGLHCILGSPQPLVSSSGMMPLHPIKNPTNLEKPPDQPSDELSFNDKSIGVPDADALSFPNGGEEKHVVKKSIPDGAYYSPSDLFDNPDPETWRKKPAAAKEALMKTKNNNVAWRTNNGNANLNSNFPNEPAKSQVIGTEKQFVLHPFASGPRASVKIPTNIITPSTTPMSELTKLIMETVTLPQMEELRYKDDIEDNQPTIVMGSTNDDQNLTENNVIPNKAEVLFLDSGSDAFINNEPMENLRRLIRKTNKEKATPKPSAETTTKHTPTKLTTTKPTTTKPTTTKHTTTVKPSSSTTLSSVTTTLRTTLKPTKSTKPPNTKPTPKPTKPTKPTITIKPTTSSSTTMPPGVEETTIDLEGEPKPDKNSTLKPNILGPPWKNEYIVGKLVVGTDEIMLDPVEVSFKVAARLCHKIGKQGVSGGLKPIRYFLWAPINQYVPLLRKAFPIRPPIFAPECLKFVLMHCRGVIKLPLLKPCTYWAPMPIKRPECGFNPSAQSHIVNYRLPEFVPGKCPCTWPCTERFDPIQRCRVTLNETEKVLDPIHSDGEPKNGREIIMQDYLALQLCRGMKLALTVDTTIPIGWVPIRVDVDSETSHIGHVHSGESNRPSARKKRSASVESESEERFKRDQVFVDPDKDNTTTSEEGEDGDEDKDDRFALMNTYNLERKYGQDGNGTNGTTIIKCKVWIYKPCPRDDGGSAEIIDEWAAQKLKRKKRAIPSYLSRFALGLNMKDDDATFWANRRFTRQTELDPDDLLEEEMDCGEWVESESYKCVPEQHLHSIIKPEEDSSSSSEEKGPKNSKNSTPHKKKVVKDLCPGSPDKFPCFLRRKRAVNDEVQDKDEKKERKREAVANAAIVSNSELSDSNAPFIINKILIQPDPGCMCDWPCLPFFDKVNKCYDEKGNVIVDQMGRNKIGMRSFRKDQRDPVTCMNFVETDEIFCKIKD